MTIPDLANPMYKKVPNGFANSICKKSSISQRPNKFNLQEGNGYDYKLRKGCKIEFAYPLK